MEALELVHYVGYIDISIAEYMYATNINWLVYRYVGKTRHIRIRGSCTIPTAITRKPMPYKYVVVPRHEKRKKASTKPEYEFVAPGWDRGIVNRVLVIPEALKGQASG